MPAFTLPAGVRAEIISSYRCLTRGVLCRRHAQKESEGGRCRTHRNPRNPEKRSKLKLLLLAGAPLLVAGGGYAGWIFAAPALGFGAAGHAEAAGDGKDAMHVAALPPEILAENSFTYTFALSELLKDTCGPTRVVALKAASAEEAKADGGLTNLSWIAATRRAGALTQQSCDKILTEIDRGELKAMALAAEKDKGAAKPAAAH